MDVDISVSIENKVPMTCYIRSSVTKASVVQNMVSCGAIAVAEHQLIISSHLKADGCRWASDVSPPIRHR